MNSAETSDYVGRSVPRREDEYLLRGQGQFLDDLPEPRNTLHLAFVLSPHPHARIVSIDASAAESLEGVVAVITGAELAKIARPMLESISARLCERGGAHYGAPDKDPQLRLDMIEAAGRQNVPFTSGILIGIGETKLEIIASLLALHDTHASVKSLSVDL